MNPGLLGFLSAVALIIPWSVIFFVGEHQKKRAA